jgi:putative hemolysin
MTPTIDPILEIAARAPTAAYPAHPELVPPGTLRAGRYRLRFAESRADLERVQRLRFEVFNRELGEGLRSSVELGLDRDAYDPCCHHLMVIHDDGDRVVGTYRLMTGPLAEARGFYSDGEFDLSGLPESIKESAVEVGRACVARPHRNGRVIHLLWRGLARYLEHNRKRFLFGCCSVPTLDPVIVRAMYLQLKRTGKMHDSIWLRSRAGAPPILHPRVDATEAAPPPPLFQSYLKLGARVCSAPAFDYAFGVSDFLVLLDLEAMEPAVRRSFFARALWS